MIKIGGYRAIGTAEYLTLLQLFVYDHGQPLNSFPTSNNKMFSICASAIQCGALNFHKPFNLNISMGPGTLTQGLGPPFRVQAPYSGCKTLTHSRRTLT